VSMPPQKFAI